MPYATTSCVLAIVAEEDRVATPGHEADVLCHTTEVRAVKDGRYVCQGSIIAHAGKSIDNHFRVVHPGRSQRRLNECERGGCDDPMSGLHDYLPPCAGRNALGG